MDKQWNWFGMVSTLAGDDPTKFEAVYKLPIMFALNFLTYKKMFLTRN